LLVSFEAADFDKVISNTLLSVESSKTSDENHSAIRRVHVHVPMVQVLSSGTTVESRSPYKTLISNLATQTNLRCCVRTRTCLRLNTEVIE
jgi:hypothetical protein